MGEIMELIKDFLIIIGIFVCMSLGIFFLLHSGDAKKKTKQYVYNAKRTPKGNVKILNLMTLLSKSNVIKLRILT